MKKIVMILAMAATVTFGYAQDDQQSKRMQPPTPEQMTQRMAEELGLNEQQTQQLQALNAEYKDVLAGPGMHRGHGRPMRRDSQGGQQPPQFDKPQDGPAFGQRPQMSDEQREQMRAKMEEMKVRRDEYDQKVQQILTKEQYEKMKQMRPNRGMRGGIAPIEPQDKKMKK